MGEAGEAMAQKDSHMAASSLARDLPHLTCGQFQPAIEFIGRRWIGAIVFVLLDGPRRFNELLAKIPSISDRLLAERLRELESAGVVTREVQPGPPVRVVYELTDAGRDLFNVIASIAEWAEKWMPGAEE